MIRNPLRKTKWGVWAMGLLLIAGVGYWLSMGLLFRYHRSQGQAALENRQFERARKSFLAAERVQPHNGELHFRLARVARRLGNFDEMKRRLKLAETAGIDRSRCRREWWLALAQTGHIAQVERYLPKLLSDPGEDAPEICEAFVNGYCLNLQFDAARTILDAWESDYPNDPQPHIQRADAFSGLQEWGQAVAEYQRALQIAPQSNDAQLGLAQSLLKDKRPQKAVEYFRSYLERFPEDQAAWLGLGHTHRELEQLEQAAKCYRQVIARDSHHFEAQYQLAAISFQTGKVKQAVQQLQPLVDAWPQDLQARYLLARCLQSLGQRDQAAEHFEAARQMDAIRARAEELANQVRKNPQDPELRFELGRLMLNHLSRREGVSWLRSVFQFVPHHAGAHQLLAQYHEKRDEIKQANHHRKMAASGAADSAQTLWTNSPFDNRGN